MQRRLIRSPPPAVRAEIASRQGTAPLDGGFHGGGRVALGVLQHELTNSKPTDQSQALRVRWRMERNLNRQNALS